MSSEDNKRERRLAHSPPDAISYSDVDSQMGEFLRKVELNERILHRLQQYELMLLDASSLPALLDVLLLATPRQFGLTAVGLTLYDPEGLIKELAPDDLHFDKVLSLEHDSFEMQRLYGATPTVEVIDYDDARLDKVMIDDSTAQSAVLLPLVRGDMLVGSFHWLSTDVEPFASEVEVDFIQHLAAIITICLENCVNSERLSQLSLLDPLTRLSNGRAFEMELRKEIARAQRGQKSLTLVFIEVDDFKDVADNYGHLSADFTLKSLSAHMAQMLRSTDLIARCGPSRFALLLPACGESKGHEIAERMRSDTEFMEIDDGRGANLFASLSMGLSTWHPKNYPAVNMEQLAGQIQTTAGQALQRSADGGGNRVSVSRLTTMLV